MGALSKIEPTAQIIPFNPMAAYQREREYSRTVETRLSKALMLLSMATDKREQAGDDVAHIRAFIRECGQ